MTDLVAEFNKFIEEWCPEYPHLIDDDENAGERFRQMLRDAQNFVGVEGAAEHRTVGPHRAWCHQDAEWCYPDDLCDCCHYALGHEKVWKTRRSGHDQ